MVIYSNKRKYLKMQTFEMLTTSDNFALKLIFQSHLSAFKTSIMPFNSQLTSSLFAQQLFQQRH
jgi:hypothetical protein